MSHEAKTWVKTLAKELGRIGRTPKAVLKELANWADADGRAWPLVPSIANEVEVDERSVIRALKRLEELELIRHESWITPKGSSKRRPIYRLAMPDTPPFDPDPDLKKRGGNQPKRIHKGCQNVTLESDARVTGCHPSQGGKGDTDVTFKGDKVSPKKKDTNSSGDKSPSPRVRFAHDLAEVILAAMPPEYLGRTSVREVASALRAEAAKGADLEAVTAGVLAYLGNRKAWGASGDPMAPHKLIASGRWETALRAATPKGSPRARTGFAVPSAFRADFVREHGEAAAASWLDPCEWRASDQMLLARTGQGEEWLRKRGYRVERQLAAGKVG